LQGDLMFTKSTLETKSIDGTQYVVFQPNTIAYAVPVGSDLANQIKAAKIGIVFHTSYDSPTSMSASFNISINSLKASKDVWFQSATLRDTSGTALMTSSETAVLTSILSAAGKEFQKMKPGYLNGIADHDKFKALCKQHINARVREGTIIKNPKKFAEQFVQWLSARYDKLVGDLKSEKGKERRRAEGDELLALARDPQLVNVFSLMSHLIAAKRMVVRKLESIDGHAKTFLRTPDGYKVTSPEGFVAVDHLSGNALKVVDRLEFSRSNFNATKNWGAPK
jgi:hypothetical protein